MSNQLDLLTAIEQATQAGINKAINTANKKMPKWGEHAYAFLISYVMRQRLNQTFSIEMVRAAAQDIVPEAPSARAWGYVVRRAVFDKIIEPAGYTHATDVKCHMGLKRLWRKAG